MQEQERMMDSEQRTKALTALLDRLRSCKPGHTYALDPVERELLLSEIDSLRQQFFDGVLNILSKAKETNDIVRDANARLDRAGVPRV
jgi:hypothetical protein